MEEEQYWLIRLKAEDFFGPQPFDGKEVAKIIALTPTREEPEFSALMNGIMDGLGIGGRNTESVFSYDIGYLCPNEMLLDKLASLRKWEGKDLKLWIASRTKDTQ
jgi:hypothetical protein